MQSRSFDYTYVLDHLCNSHRSVHRHKALCSCCYCHASQATHRFLWNSRNEEITGRHLRPPTLAAGAASSKLPASRCPHLGRLSPRFSSLTLTPPTLDQPPRLRPCFAASEAAVIDGVRQCQKGVRWKCMLSHRDGHLPTRPCSLIWHRSDLRLPETGSLGGDALL